MAFTVTSGSAEGATTLNYLRPRDVYQKAREYEASGIMDAIDGLAEAITGNRAHFHLRAPTTPGPKLPSMERDERTDTLSKRS